MEKIQMSINRWMDKQNVTFQYIYNAVSFSLKNRQVPYICDSVDEPGVCYAKWNQQVTEGHMLYYSTYIKFLK